MPLLIFLALLAGALFPLQVGVNTHLQGWLGHPLLVGLVSFMVGTLGLGVAVAVYRVPLPAATTLGQAPWWGWLGGLLGAIYITMSVVLAPRLGATTLLAAIVAGQMLASLMLDHFGAVGLPEHPASAGRLLGAALVVVGVLVIHRS